MFACFGVVVVVMVVVPVDSALLVAWLSTSTLTRWKVMADFWGSGCVIFPVETFCKVVRWTLPAGVSKVLV